MVFVMGLTPDRALTTRRHVYPQSSFRAPCTAHFIPQKNVCWMWKGFGIIRWNVSRCRIDSRLRLQIYTIYIYIYVWIEVCFGLMCCCCFHFVPASSPFIYTAHFIPYRKLNFQVWKCTDNEKLELLPIGKQRLSVQVKNKKQKPNQTQWNDAFILWVIFCWRGDDRWRRSHLYATFMTVSVLFQRSRLWLPGPTNGVVTNQGCIHPITECIYLYYISSDVTVSFVCFIFDHIWKLNFQNQFCYDWLY